MSHLRISNGVVALDLHWVTETTVLAEALIDFLHPWFQQVSVIDMPDLTLKLFPSSEFCSDWQSLCVEPFILRSSSASIFNLVVKRGISAEGLTLAWDDTLQVGYVINPLTSSVDFYGSFDNAFIHLIELVRYYGLLVEQANGTVILHSAAVRRKDGNEVIAIVGAKGAGKTTTMLSMLTSGDYVYFSGDKLLLDLFKGQLRVRGWPDYPHIGIGTLRNHPILADRLGIVLFADDGSPLSDKHKVLLEPSRFLSEIGKSQQGYGTLTQLVLPRINETRDISLISLDQNEKNAVSQADLFEWPNQFITAIWHGLPLTNNIFSLDVAHTLVSALHQLPWIYNFKSIE